jgi:type VI secretion system secreted protein VgrG
MINAAISSVVGAADAVLPHVTYELAFEQAVEHPPWQVGRVDISEDLSGEHAATLWLENDDPNANERDLRGRSACLLVARPGLGERRFAGVVRTVVSEGIDAAGVRRCRLTLVPAFQCLDETVEWRKFVDMTVPDVLRAVLREGLEPFGRQAELRLGREDGSATPAAPFARREYTAQRGESVYAFVRRLCSEEGLALWYETTGAVETLVVSDDNRAFARHDAPLRLIPPGGSAAVAFESVSAFEMACHRVPTAATVARFDLTRPMTTLVERVQLEPAPNAGPAGRGEIYDPTGAVTLHAYQGDRYTGEDVGYQARIRLEAAQLGADLGTGGGDAIAFRPGLVFRLEPSGGFPSPLEGEYLITQIRHSGEAGRRGAAGLQLGASYRNSFLCVPSTVAFRPSRIPRPLATVDYAVVAAVSDEDPIHHDAHGRVKVKFWWDRSPGAPSDRDSGWVPVVTPWAGAGRGIQAVPRQGDVVLVNYDLGDPDRPVVVGSANTATNPLLYDLHRKTAVAWRTQSQRPDGAGGFTTPNYNELLMDDDAGKERFSVYAGWDYDRRVLNDESTCIDHDENRTVCNDQTITVNGNQTITVKKNCTLTVNQNENITVDGSRTVSVGGAETITVGGAQTTTVTGPRTTTVVGPDTVTLTSRHTEVSATDSEHVAGDATAIVDGAATLTQGGTVIEVASGHVDVNAQSWVRLKHGGAEVVIDGGDNVTVRTDAKVYVFADDEVSFQAPKITFTGTSAVAMTVGANTVKVDTSGVHLNGAKIDETADSFIQMTAPAIRNNN